MASYAFLSFYPSTIEEKGSSHFVAAALFLLRTWLTEITKEQVQHCFLSPIKTAPTNAISGPNICILVYGRRCCPSPQLGQRLQNFVRHTFSAPTRIPITNPPLSQRRLQRPVPSTIERLMTKNSPSLDGLLD